MFPSRDGKPFFGAPNIGTAPHHKPPFSSLALLILWHYSVYSVQ